MLSGDRLRVLQTDNDCGGRVGFWNLIYLHVFINVWKTGPITCARYWYLPEHWLHWLKRRANFTTLIFYKYAPLISQIYAKRASDGKSSPRVSQTEVNVMKRNFCLHILQNMYEWYLISIKIKTKYVRKWKRNSRMKLKRENSTTVLPDRISMLLWNSDPCCGSMFLDHIKSVLLCRVILRQYNDSKTVTLNFY